MPARLIRSTINRSESLAAVSPMAELLFRALLVEADDFGRLDARPTFLKATLFPLRDTVTREVIEACLVELESLDDPPLRRYVVDGRPILWLTGWERHRSNSKRATSSKYPAPPALDPLGSPGAREIRRSPGSPGNPGDPPADGDGDVGGDAGPAPPTLAPTKRRRQTEPGTEDFEAMASTNALGVPVTPEEVACWFEMKAPAMRARNLTDLRRAAVHWWSRLTREELDAARRRLANLRVAKLASEHEPADGVDEADVSAALAALGGE